MGILSDIHSDLSQAGIRKNTPQSALWFKKNVKKLAGLNRNELMKDDRLDQTQDVMPGYMYMYFYDPKHKKTLPYYDRFPLIIMVDAAPGGFYGLNLHYLSPIVRYKFLRDLSGTLSDRRYNDKTRFQITYKRLKAIRKFKEFQPCYKHYLTKHIRSQMVRVPANEWEAVVYLPTEQFVGSGKGKVWADSLRKI